ncbi:hypothetical protein EK21DRAFT_89667 [Setomelanomma holmii]|uniref:Peptidase C1A papain C-terminal domain-containing protein n=1 Tax=Setomelanomma holmii TaxID=210430 RepID=A0A9P4H7C6_9PLEO|nr:hypothetical protein EK21DRAFT_89667 [Setomelanomma holmii]
MATGNPSKGGGHVPDKDDVNDKMIAKDSLHSLDHVQIESFDIFKNTFRLDPRDDKNQETMHYDQLKFYDQGTAATDHITAAKSTLEERGAYFASLRDPANYPKDPITADDGTEILTCFTGAQQVVQSFHYVRPMQTVECWKQCISNGYPLICGVDEFANFASSTCNHPYVAAWPTKNDKFETRHTVLVVGWTNELKDDKRNPVLGADGKSVGGVFKVRNSWGTTWPGVADANWNGFFYMPYSWITKESLNKNGKVVDSPWVIVDRASLIYSV